jgi:tRNA synthetases class I (E and Q), catalytic domain
MSTAPVVTRFAPSPTGELHLGNALTNAPRQIMILHALGYLPAAVNNHLAS